MRAGHRGAGRRRGAVSVDTMRAEVAERGARGRRRDRQRRLRRAGRPGCSTWWPARARRTSRCTGGRTPTMMQRLRVVRPGRWRGRASCATSSRRGSRRSRRPASTADRLVLDPGLGFAKTRRAQLGAAARARRARGPRAAAAGRRQPQVVPRRAAGRPGRRACVRSSEREAATAALTTVAGPAQPAVWGVAGARRPGQRATPSAVVDRLSPRRLAGRRSDGRPLARRSAMSWPSRGIECFGHHGVFDFERRDGQVFVIDLTLGLDTRAGGGLRRLAGHRRLRKSRRGGEGRRGATTRST